MSDLFQYHGYALGEFERCERDGAPLMRVCKDAEPVCLLEWLAERAGGKAVVDVIPRDAGKYNLPAVVLQGGFVLPVEWALDAAAQRQGEEPVFAEVDLRLADWRVSDVLYLPGEAESVSVELLPPGTVVDEKPGVLLRLNLDMLLHLLWEEEIVKYEP